MAKYNVNTIKEQADRTLETYRGRPGEAVAKQLTICQMRCYINKVLFLCKEIKQLIKKLEKHEGHKPCCVKKEVKK